MQMKSIILLLMLTTLSAQAQRIKVACVGNSVTYGAGIQERETYCYPAQLQGRLGDGFEVKNFGKSGATLLSKGHRPYREQEEYKQAVDFAADKVVIHLGLNDTDPRNWPHFKDEFIGDYLSLITDFRKANPKAEIWICRMTPIFHSHPRFKSGTRDWFWQIQQAIESIAELAQVSLIDLHTSLYERPDLFPDALHPDKDGARIIASTVYKALSGDYGGLQIPAIYADNMVLQRDQALTVSGKANAGEKVSLSIGEQYKEAYTDKNGNWKIEIAPLKTEQTYELDICSQTNQYHFKNILAGDVWLCSGQSNMAFQMKESVPEEVEEQLRYASQCLDIRLYNRKVRWETTPAAWSSAALDSVNNHVYYQDARWDMCSEETVRQASAVAFAFGRMLADSLQVPIGLILNPVGGSPVESWIDRKTLEFDFPDVLYVWQENDFIQPWVRERAKQNMEYASSKLQRHPYEPAYLFESGISPLKGFPIKGVIWYQGESNAHNIEAHEKLFPLLVRSWRSFWEKEDLPFYYVQLSSLNRPSWPQFRDSQRRLMYTVPDVGMVVSSDRGDSLDVHPRYKKEVGERLARWALAQTYDYLVVPSGPLVQSVEFVRDTAVVSFDFADCLQTSDQQPLQGFEIATYDGFYFPAQTKIEGSIVKVWSEKVADPRFVRYGWQPFTRANLINGERLPASTFQIPDNLIKK